MIYRIDATDKGITSSINHVKFIK